MKGELDLFAPLPTIRLGLF